MGTVEAIHVTGDADMPKSLLPLVWCAAVACVAPAGAAAETHWQAFADCAAGYLANWQDRRSDPSRSKQMADTIRSQSKDYEATAVRRYADQNRTAEAQAEQAVRAYVKGNLARFIALDKKGQLNRFLDACPQPDENGNL